ncbi:hypothetical protein HOP50_03g21790 [Chloropicon primus]|uniref:Uncharacterized protein n=1 Tax=Chloropicon primus TaxID=1764295 RepID=A0A5B8MHA4_9CHLO|nr:hypothetical protein A3770_03p21790 [Chloropicon primus]UPQ98873.1 hypothetical protein HOP50_03g21790 [Chloropicon primus]|eukprot:QDZ19661.1 hypothetical protein A3770_03p21790 [Chloropicon primus]
MATVLGGARGVSLARRAGNPKVLPLRPGSVAQTASTSAKVESVGALGPRARGVARRGHVEEARRGGRGAMPVARAAAGGEGGAVSKAESKGDDDLFFGYTALSCVQALWLLSGLLGTWAFGAWPYGKNAGYYFLGFGETTALLMPQLAASVVLRSAALRGRLTGTTFKVLNLSLLVSSTLLFVAEVFQSISEGGIGFKTLSATITAAISYIALKRHGWPTFKFELGENKLLALSKGYFGLSACTGVFMVLNTLGSGVLSFLFGKLTGETILEPHHFITFAALLAIQGGILHTLQTAAVAGEKRLSSETYRNLNLGVILSAISALMGIFWASTMKCQVLWVFLTLGVYNIAQLVACSSGFYLGKTYKA